MNSRTLRAGLLVALAGAAAAPSQAQNLTLEPVAAGFASPVAILSEPEDASRLYVVEQQGRVRLIKDGVVQPTPFIDISGITSCCGERGLLGMAFHPDYATNGRFFLSYTNNSGNTRLREYARDPVDPDVAVTPGILLYSVGQPFSNHNGGCIQFGADGKLYLGLGDGGSGNDPLGAGQDLTTPLGKMLRFDVDLPAPYVPADNPFVGNPNALDEIWAFGLRNPWRFAFDPGTGDLWIGDVGQNAWEEIDFQPASSPGGENYGWRCMEGLHCTGLSGCTCNDTALTLPIHEYSHSSGCSVTGGVVYRGPDMPALRGTYFFGDYCSSRVWSMRYENGQVLEFTDRTLELSGPIGNITSFGQDADGDVYIIDQQGDIHRVVQDCGAASYCDAEPNSSGQPSTISMTGSASVTVQGFGLSTSNLPAGQFAYYLGSRTDGFLPFPGGAQGNLCLSGNIARFNAQLAQVPANGVYAIAVDLNAIPTTPTSVVSPGETWFFQCWHRDQNPGNTSNFSNGLGVQFCP